MSVRREIGIALAMGLAVSFILLGCESDDDSMTREVAGGASVAGEENGGDAGADQSGGAGGAGPSGCALDAEGRTSAEIALQQTVAETFWITTQTQGTGVRASRGFGFGIPFTTRGALFTASLTEECTAAKTFDEHCSGSEDEEPGPEACSRLECLEAGKLQITTWMKPLPFTEIAYPSPGEVEVQEARQTVTFTEQEEDIVSVEWTTDLEVVPPDADAVTIAEMVTATVGDPSRDRVDGHVTVAGLGGTAGVLSLDYQFEEGEVSGSAAVAGDHVLDLTIDGPVWSAGCSP